jgi:hypothetical protein
MLDSAYNIKIDFGATTGHTVGDKWTGTATAVNTDTGIFSNRNAGSNYTHVGMYFDVSTNKWTFLNAYDSEPGVVINPANGTYGVLKAATYEGNLTGNVTGQVSDISNFTTTNLAEGTNQYFTEARARNALKVGGTSLSYDSATGQLSYSDSDRNATQIKGLFSAAGSLSYNSGTGEFSYTDSDRSRAQILGLFSASGGGLSYNSSTGAFTDSDRTRQQITELFTADGKILGYNNTTGAFSVDSSDIRNIFSASSGLKYNNATALFELDSNAFTPSVRAQLSATSGIKYTSGTGLIELDSSAFTSSVRTQISGDKGLVYNSSTGVLDVDSANIRGMFSAAGSLSYNSGTGEFSYTDSDRSASAIKGLFSAAGSLSYNSSTGEFSYTDSDRSASAIKGLFSGAGDITYNSSTGEFSYTDSDRSAAQIKGLFSADGKVLGYNSTTGLFSVDSADISSIITADVDKAFVDALNVDADTLDGQDGTYYRINVYNAAGTLLN